MDFFETMDKTADVALARSLTGSGTVADAVNATLRPNPDLYDKAALQKAHSMGIVIDPRGRR